MQTRQESSPHSIDRLELLAAFNSIRAADKPLSRSQSELALEAVLNASLVVGSFDQQSKLPGCDHPGSRASSLPVGVPSCLPPQAPRPSLSCASAQALPHFLSQVNGNLLPLSKLAALQADRLPIKTNLYKTEMCRGWEATGRCRYGSKCQFAHGQQELQPVQRHPRYKTEICRTFSQTGFCRYGKRCRFIHPETTTDDFCLHGTTSQLDAYNPYFSLVPQHDTYFQQPCPSIHSRPGSPSYATPQAVPQYPRLHPTIYQDHSLRPVLVSPEVAHYSGLPYSPASSTQDTDVFSALARPDQPKGSTANRVDTGDSGLLGSGYGSQESGSLTLGEALPGAQANTSPRSVLEYAALQGCGSSSATPGCTYTQAAVPKHFASTLFGDFTTYA